MNDYDIKFRILWYSLWFGVAIFSGIWTIELFLFICWFIPIGDECMTALFEKVWK